MKDRWFSTTPSLQIQMLYLIDLWHHRNIFELGKIPDRNAIVHDSKNPAICDRKIWIPWPAFVRKNPLMPVLLYKHSALRVMCMSKRDAARQWNSRQRNQIIEMNTNCSQALIFHEILKSRCFTENRWCTIIPSPAIHLLHFIDLWHHRNVFKL